jgi:putative peptidoglycan lipid II flippase
MIKKLFGGQINSVTIAALVIALSSLVSRFLGIFRDRILAGEFGAGDTLDIYYAAFRVPDLIFNLLVLGALSAGFVPVLTRLIKDWQCQRANGLFGGPNKQAWDLVNDIFNLLAVVLVFLSALGIILAPFLIKLIAPGFPPAKQNLTIELTRIMFLSPVFLGLSSVFGGILQSFKRFFVYSLTPIVYNLGIIVGALYFVPIWGVKGLAYGVILGAFFHLAIQVPVVWRLGWRPVWQFDWRNKYVKEIAAMMLPRTLTLAIGQINLLAITIIASTLLSGSLAVFNFANNLQSFFIGIFGISFAVAAFPTLSSIAFDRKKLVGYFSRIFRQILFFIVPSTVLLLTLRAQIIRVILGIGRFDWEDTILTMNTLAFFALSLFAQASLPLLLRVFYARQDAKTPFLIGLFSAAANIGFSLYFSSRLGVAGLALAFSLASILNFILLWLFLRVRLDNLDEERILISAVKFSASALAAGIVIQGTKLLIWPYIDMTRTWGVFTQGAVAGVAGILVYLAFCSLLRSEEFFYFWQAFKNRLPWKKIKTGDQGEVRGI